MTKYLYGIGRRKTASARVRLFEGKGESKINGREISSYITRKDLFDVVFSPLKMCKVKDDMHFTVEIDGSGISAQAQAISHGLSRVLADKDVSFRAILKAAGLLTRDARKVERKKPGHHKARKGMQWSKR